MQQTDFESAGRPELSEIANADHLGADDLNEVAVTFENVLLEQDINSSIVSHDELNSSLASGVGLNTQFASMSAL